MEERTFLDLTVSRHPDGDWNLKQGIGPCDPSDEHWIILAPEHLDTLARMAGYLPASEVHRGCERVQERLALLGAMVRAHTREGDPLRAAVACLLKTEVPKTAPVSGTENGTLRMETVPKTGQLQLEIPEHHAAVAAEPLGD